MRKTIRVIGSLLISAGILALVFRETGQAAREVAQALWTMGAWVWGGYALAQLVQGWLRAVRYRLLLAGAGVCPLPGRGRMFGVTLARNMFVDMLPARAGELMYWALLNRGEGVEHEDCVSSMTISVLFDFLALAAVLAFAVASPMLESGGRVAFLWGGGVVLGAVAVGGWLLFRGPGWAVWAVEKLPAAVQRWKMVSRVEGFMEKLAVSFGQVKGSGVLASVVGLSVAIRIVKYLGLAVAFYGVARVLRPALADLPVWQVLVGLIGGEGGASLPMPTFLSLGTYEASGAGAMHLAGVPGTDAALLLLGTHVASQIVDYALGGLGLLGLLWGGRRSRARALAPDSRAGRANPILLVWTGLLLFALAAAATWAWKVQKETGTREAPGAGGVIPMGQLEIAAMDDVWGEKSGFIVWSSTMYGQHDLIRMDWPSGRLTHLTRDPYVDSTPKISPDGKRVVFARSTQEWVSFRNKEGWSIWVLDMETGREQLLAEQGSEPCWSGDGQSVVFHRGGRDVVQLALETGEVTVLLGPQEKRVWTGPSVDPAGGRVAVTVRGARRSTSLFSVPGGAETRVAGGCQLAFVPGGEWMVLVEDGGRMKNRICRVDSQGKQLETLIDMPGFWSHEYFPRVSNDGSLLVFGASREGHEHDTADYEIFLWRIGDPAERAARVSFHTGNDQWPDVWVNPPPAPAKKKSKM